jgi:hypothetical protein
MGYENNQMQHVFELENIVGGIFLDHEIGAQRIQVHLGKNPVVAYILSGGWKVFWLKISVRNGLWLHAQFSS